MTSRKMISASLMSTQEVMKILYMAFIDLSIANRGRDRFEKIPL